MLLPAPMLRRSTTTSVLKKAWSGPSWSGGWTSWTDGESSPCRAGKRRARSDPTRVVELLVRPLLDLMRDEPVGTRQTYVKLLTRLYLRALKL